MIEGAPVMDIVVWLRSLGLAKYEAIFRENDRRRDGSPKPDAREPEGAWRLHVGHRRKILDTIAVCVTMGACRHHLSRQHPLGLLLRRRLPHPSRKPLASADMSR